MGKDVKAEQALLSSLRVVDLSHTIDSATKPYPGDPVPCLETVADIKHDGCSVATETLVTLWPTSSTTAAA